jgi:hypothetical protein
MYSRTLIIILKQLEKSLRGVIAARFYVVW